MKKQNLDKGRVKQKLQTREHILHTAKGLLKKKKNWGLEDVANEAGVSRATVYRYFSNIDLLITETSLDIHHKTTEELCKEVENMNLTERLMHIQEYYNSLSEKHETGFRRYLSVALKESTTSRKQIRGARRPKSYEAVIQSSNNAISKDIKIKLTRAATLLSGIDARILCKDVNNMNSKETDEFLEWCLQTIIESLIKNQV